MEWAQRGWAEDAFTYLYRLFLRRRTKLIYQQMLTILDQRLDQPDTVLVVATHFGLAHQLAAIKEKLQNERKVKFILIVIVTDDSPQQLWYIEGADLIFTPTESTKAKLIEYGQKANLKKVAFEVNSYPVTSSLAENLTEFQLREKLTQVEVGSQSKIHVAIPISGAAVGTEFFTILIDALYQKSKRFNFHVISKLSLHTQHFLNQMLKRPYVTLHVSGNDRGVLDKYEQVYRKELISLEITKPSEQAFKALLASTQKGGSVLLFSEPVGRQEYDNLDFLRRHGLIPNLEIQQNLWKESKDKQLNGELLKQIDCWRGVELLRDPIASAEFIWWAVNTGIFSKLISCKTNRHVDDRHAKELSPNGVHEFWQKVKQFLDQPNVNA
jgi:hypothetical protein